MRHFFASLRVRIILLVVLAVVPAATMILYGVSEQKRLAGNEILANALKLAEFAAYKDEQFIEGTRQILLSLAHFLSFGDSNCVDCQSFMSSLLRQFRRYANFGAVHLNGEMFCTAVPFERQWNTGTRSWFKRVLDTHDFAIGDYQMGAVTEKPVLVLAAPALDRQGAIQSVVFAAIDLEWLNRFHVDPGFRMPQDSFLEMVDRSGIVLSRYPDPQVRIGHALGSPDLNRAIHSGQAQVLRVPGPDRSPHIYAVAPVRSKLRGEAVSVIFGVPERVAFARANRILKINLMLFAGVTILVFAAAWFGGDLMLLRQLKALVQASKRLTAGDLEARSGLQHDPGELGQLALVFDEMAAALKRREQEHVRAESEIRSSREQLRKLAVHSQTVREEERMRIAREIHDDLGQAITALKIDLSWLERRLSTEETLLHEKIGSMSKIIDAGMDTVHRISAELRPGILDDLGLAEAIEWQAEEFQKRTGIDCEVILGSEKVGATRDQATTIFRIFQETLTNAARHAGASRIDVNLYERDGRITLVVKDDGTGITREQIARPDSYGIMGMRERALSLGGEVSISGQPDAGTTVTVILPVDSETDAHD